MTDYSEFSKVELLDNIEARRKAGRDIPDIKTASAKGEFIAALELDDEINGVFDGGDTSPDKIKQQAEALADGTPGRQVPDDLDEYSGRYKYIRTGEIFGLKIMPPEKVRSGKTHHAKSPLKFWDGTEEEFRACFDKL
jgi:hypothetical protein